MSSNPFTRFSVLGETCPICNGEHKRCRTNEDRSIIICGSQVENPDYTYRGPDRAGIGYKYVLSTIHKPAKPFEIPSKPPENPAKNTLHTPEELDRLFKEFFSKSKVPNWAKSDIEKRGLNPSGLLGHTLPKGYLEERYQDLPGVYQHALGLRVITDNLESYFCPVYDQNGYVVGGQLRMRDSSVGKYLWLSAGNKGGITHKINGKTPLTFCYHNTKKEIVFNSLSKNVKNVVIFSEGILKPSVINIKTGYPVIGASGGNFTTNTDNIDEFIKEVKKTSTGRLTFALAVDAGAGKNPLVMKKYQQLHRYLQKKYDTGLKVIWYGQYSKHLNPDFDELDFNQNKHFDLIDFYSFEKTVNTRNRLTIYRDFTANYKFNARYIPANETLWGDELLNPLDEFKRFVADGERRILAVKSPMGTGKTEILKSLSDEIPLLILGYRNALLEQTCNRISNAQMLSSLGGQTLEGLTLSPGLCVDSALKVPVEFSQKRVVVIDECPLVVKHLLDSETCKKYRVEIEKRVKDLLSNAAGVIILSDQLTDKEVNFITQLSNTITPIKVVTVENTFKMPARTISNHNKRDSWRQAYVNAVRNGETTLALFDSRNQTEVWEAKIKLLAPSKKILVINSETLYKPEVEAFLKDPNSELLARGYSHILCSPTAESGLSIDVRQYFDKVFMYWSHLGIDACEQMMHRLRDESVPIELFVYTRTNTQKTVYDVVEKRLDNAKSAWLEFSSVKIPGLTEEQNKEIEGELKGKAYRAFDPNNPRWKYLSTNWEIQLLEQQYFRSFLIANLEERGYIVKSIETEKIEKEDISTVKESDLIKTQKTQRILDSQLLSSEDYEVLNRQEIKTPQQIAELVRFRIEQALPGIDLTDAWGLECIKKITQDNWDSIGKMLRRQLWEYPYLIEGSRQKTKMFLYGNNFYPTDINDKYIVADRLAKLITKEDITTKDLHDKHPVVLRIVRKANRDSFLPKQGRLSNIKYFNTLLDLLGYKTTGKQRRVNGERVRFYNLTDGICYEKNLEENATQSVPIYPLLAPCFEQSRLNFEASMVSEAFLKKYKRKHDDIVRLQQPPPIDDKEKDKTTHLKLSIELPGKSKASATKSRVETYKISQIHKDMYVDATLKTGLVLSKGKVIEVFDSHIKILMEIDKSGNYISPSIVYMPGDKNRPETTEKTFLVSPKNINGLWTLTGPGKFTDPRKKLRI